jgi:amidase
VTRPHEYLEEQTIAQLQDRLASGELTARSLLQAYIERIRALDQSGPGVRSVLELNPDAEQMAAAMDGERRTGRVRGPLHGIPLLIKDNIDTADRMHTTAGSLALSASHPARDATVAARLREAGAVILGKANLSEWANFRSTRSSSGWSGRGGQTRNPFVLDRTPCGSSSGSAAAVSANLVAVALGTETDGSIVCPSNACGVVGIKPTVGLTSRAGVIPISHSQDTVGPHARTVEDAAVLLAAIAGADPLDPATAGAPVGGYNADLQEGGLEGSRIGVLRSSFGFHDGSDRIAEEAAGALRDAGATIIDPVELNTTEEMRSSGVEKQVLLYEFKAGLNAYLAERSDPEVSTLAGLIEFNLAHAGEELRWFGQETLLESEACGPLSDPAYVEALETSRRLSREQGIDAVMDEHRLHVLLAPTSSPAWTIDLVDGDRRLGGSSQPAAMAGYPIVTVPAGFLHGHLPLNVTLMGRAWSEPLLVQVAHAFERCTRARRAPGFVATLPG